MENAGKQIEDEELAAVLHEKGIGTPATRADIIENLIAKGYVVRLDKSLRPAVKGIRLIDTLNRIHQARRALVAFHRIQWAERETVLAVMRPDVPFIMPETRTYMRDCFDHALAVLELVESYREMTNGLMEVYLMHASNRMSEVMKTMAIITVFFMPLSFLAGIYGMNFDRDHGNMPELGWRYGYVFFWGMVVVIVISLFIWLKRKRWI